MKFIKGDTVESQIRHIDIVLTRFSRRLHKTVTGIVTPYPISNYVSVPVDDVILRYMFPARGMITVGSFHIETMPKSGIHLSTSLENDIGKSEKSYFVKRNRMLIEPNADVFSGDRLTIQVKRVNAEEGLAGIWVSFLWVPVVSDAEVKRHLIDSLDKQENDYASESEEG